MWYAVSCSCIDSMDTQRTISGYKKILSVCFIDMELFMISGLNILKMELYQNILRKCTFYHSFSKMKHSFLNENE